MDDHSSDHELQALREQIAAADRELVEAFARRLSVAREIKRLKVERGYSFIDPEREKQLLAQWLEMAGGGLSGETVSELFEKVLELSKREARRGAAGS